MGANDLLLRILAKNETKAAFGEVKSGISSLTGALAGFGIGLSAVGIARFSAEAVKLAASAMPIEQAFNSMASSLGQNADSMLADLQRISKGAIDQTALMTAANTAMLLGGKTLASELPTLLEVARAGSIALGQDMQFMFQSIITGIARQSPLILDNLGIVVDLETANRNYAASLGITVEAMTEAQKQQALLNDILRVAPDYIASVGAESTTAAEQIKTLAAATTEFKTAWGELLLEIGVGDALSNAATAMRDLTDEVGRADYATLILQLNAMVGELERVGRREEAGKLARQIDALRLSGLGLDAVIPRLQALRASVQGLDPTKVGAMVQSLRNLAALGPALAATAAAMNGMGPMSQAGPVSPLLQNQSSITDYMSTVTLDQFVQDFLAGDEIIAKDAKDTAKSVSSAWKDAYDDVRSTAEGVLQPANVTELDMLLTSLGKYKDKPMEAGLRLQAIAERGFAELTAHPDWAAALKIPPEILAASQLELQAWAMETKASFDALARPDLIDWDAFQAEFKKKQDETVAKGLTLDIAAGFGAGIPKPTTADIVSALGLDKPELVAAAIGQGLSSAFDANNPATAMLSSISTKVDTQELGYRTTGQKAGGWLGDAVKSAALLQLDGFLPDLAARLSPYLVLPGGNPPP